tara:strand:- start:53 stop:364 length:312 start_codon:yes stop_codon:yes gene_type:complete
VIDIILNANRPILFKICIISFAQEKLYAHKFHGKPLKIFDLKKSENARPEERRSKEEKLYFRKGPKIKVTNEKNKLKNKGININPNGIKILKFSSNVSEYVIQ